VGHILSLFQNGYQNCKVVSRGFANDRLHSLFDFIKQKTGSKFVYHISDTKSLNKSGYVVDDLHVLISVAGANIGGGGSHNEDGKEAVDGGSYRSRNPLASSSGINSHY